MPFDSKLPFFAFFFSSGSYLASRCVVFFLWPDVQVTCWVLLRQKACLFLAASWVCRRSRLRQNFWLFANWRQESPHTLRILKMPKHSMFVLVRIFMLLFQSLDFRWRAKLGYARPYIQKLSSWWTCDICN